MDTTRYEELRVKRNTLSAESRIIKTAEQRALRKARKRRGTNKPFEPSYAMHERLRLHRILVVRPAARAAHLAHAFLCGRAYATVENPETLHKPLPSNVVAEMVKTIRAFGGTDRSAVKDRDVWAWVEGKPAVAQVEAAAA